MLQVLTPLSWPDFFTVLAQYAMGLALLYAAALAALDVVRRWSVWRRVESDLSRPQDRRWASLADELASGGGVLLPPREAGHERVCTGCFHMEAKHDHLGRCQEAVCQREGDDQVCRSVAPPMANWSTPKGWVLFCRTCGHRMAHHETGSREADGYLCPPGPRGPGHDGPSTP